MRVDSYWSDCGIVTSYSTQKLRHTSDSPIVESLRAILPQNLVIRSAAYERFLLPTRTSSGFVFFNNTYVHT